VPSNQFYPVQHVDSHEFFPGDFVVENRTEFTYNTYGVVQKVDHAARTAVIQWLEYNPDEPPKQKELESVSVYDIKDHPDFQFRPGSCVIKIQSEGSGDFQADSSVGQVIRVHVSGQLECVWVNGSKEQVFPQDLFHIGEYDSDDLWADSESDAGDESESPANEEASKEELLSQLMETINDLESWFQNHETVNSRNSHHPMKMVLNVCKQMREVNGQFGEMTFSLNELKSLLDTTKPPESPSEITWTRVANRFKEFLNVTSKGQESGDKAEGAVSLQDDCHKTESPNSKKTTASLEALRRIKTHLFPLCTSLSSPGNQSDEPASGSSVPTDTNLKGSAAATAGEVVMSNFQMVESVPDSHRFKLSVHQPHNQKLFCSKVRQEIALLKSSLPEDIFVKAYEDRMDLFSFMIKGPKATPYEDGLFLFDAQLPADYPTHPPAVHYISFCTDRLNPNLYENGKVCVSLLGTWVGKGSEVWFPGSSNLLQVMVSIQGLILVPEPYFNEAGYLRQKGTDEGQENSRLYNEMAVVKVVQSLTKMLTLPPAAFRSEVLDHIRETGPLLTQRLAHWIKLSEEVNAGISAVPREEVAQMTEFPLLPASQGFCLSLKKALTAFQNNMSKK
jgi:ubiquitin-conjugating enzyme E2 O